MLGAAIAKKAMQRSVKNGRFSLKGSAVMKGGFLCENGALGSGGQAGADARRWSIGPAFRLQRAVEGGAFGFEAFF